MGNWRPPSIQIRISKSCPFAKIPPSAWMRSQPHSVIVCSLASSVRANAVAGAVRCGWVGLGLLLGRNPPPPHAHLERLVRIPIVRFFVLPSLPDRDLTESMSSQPSLPCPVPPMYSRLGAPMTDFVRIAIALLPPSVTGRMAPGCSTAHPKRKKT